MELFDKKPQQPNGKYSINLHRQPSMLTPEEGAVYLMMAGVLAEAKKLGVDPTTIHLTLEFKATNHLMCLNLSQGGPEIGYTPHAN
jgi:hypothetical protein